MTNYGWSFNSKARLYTCHLHLQAVANQLIKNAPMDVTIVCGARGKEDQNRWFDAGYSKVRFPDSKHNVGDGAPRAESHALDFAPYVGGSIPWDDEGSFYALAGAWLTTANRMGIRLRYGGDWDRDGLTEDQTFMDLGHIEILL